MFLNYVKTRESISASHIFPELENHHIKSKSFYKQHVNNIAINDKINNIVYLYSAFQQQCYKVLLKISICGTRKGNNQQNVIKSDASQEAVLNVVSHD